MRAVPDVGVALIKKMEIYVPRVYDDAHPAKILQPSDKVDGKLTAAWGHTSPHLVIGQTVKPEIGTAWLISDLGDAVGRLYAVIRPDVINDLTDNQWGALISFSFNVGAEKDWSIWKALNARQFDQIPMHLMQFVNVQIGGVKMKEAGLVARRAAEVALWSVDEPGSIYAPTSSSVTRAAVTPPTPIDPIPPSKSPMIKAVAGSTAAAVPGIVDKLFSLANHASLKDWIIAVIMVAALGLSITGLWFVWSHKKLSRS